MPAGGAGGHRGSASRLDRVRGGDGQPADRTTGSGSSPDGAIIGLRRPDQVASILHAAGLELGEDDVAEIENRSGLEDQR
jgi:hypothetical protein